MSTPSTYLDLADAGTGGGHQITLWWSETQQDRIHLVLTDPRLIDSEGEKPGLRLVLSSNPRSADYSPANFNRCARVLRALGMPAPDQDVPEHPRHLRYRENVIKTVLGDQALTSSAMAREGYAVPDATDVCQTCWSYVADLEKHAEAVHR
jgi:hypothetical protein